MLLGRINMCQNHKYQKFRVDRENPNFYVIKYFQEVFEEGIVTCAHMDQGS